MWCDCGRSISQYENEIKKLREDRKILKNETKRALAEIKDKGQHLELLRSLLLASPAAAAAAKGVAGADVAGEASANGDGASSAGADILAVEALVGAEKERDQLLKETDELRVLQTELEEAQREAQRVAEATAREQQEQQEALR